MEGNIAGEANSKEQNFGFGKSTASQGIQKFQASKIL